MNKTIKRNVLVSAILAIMLCVSLIAGATFALFTSESKVNIAVTSGKVDVVATMNGLTLYSPTSIDQSGNIVDDTNAATATMFANGGTATADSNTLTLVNITPGDKVTFNIDVKNNSNVTIKYRTILACESDNGLFAGLKVTINGEEYIGETRVSAYEVLAAGTGDYAVPVVIELPTTADNAYQGKTMKLSYTVQAVQGNTETNDPENDTYYIYNANDLVLLKHFAPSVNNVVLMNDIDMSGIEYVAWDFDVPAATTFTFDGQGYAIKNLTTSGYTGANTENDFQRAGLFASVGSALHDQVSTIVFKNLVMNNAIVSQTVGEQAAAGALIGLANVVNVEIDGCSVINSHINSGKYAAGFVGYVQEYFDTVSATVKNATVENNEIVGNGHTAGLVGLANRTVDVDTATIKGNTISTKFGHSAAAIVGTGSVAATNVTANDNTYIGGLRECDGETTDIIFGIYHKQCGDYTVDGTGENNSIVEAYVASAADDLKDFRDAVNAGNTFYGQTVKLYADIDLKNENWTPIGTKDHPFMGIFDGQGHTIYNLKCNGGVDNPIDLNAVNQGLFGFVYATGTTATEIKNLKIHNADIYALNSAGAFAGCHDNNRNVYWQSIVRFDNLTLTGKVTIDGGNAGGITGSTAEGDGWAMNTSITNIVINVYNGSYVSNLKARANGSISTVLGGVVAVAARTWANTIVSNIDVIGDGSHIGGVVGQASYEWHTITCTGNVTVKNADSTTVVPGHYGTVVGSIIPILSADVDADSISGTGTLTIECADGTVINSNGEASNAIGGSAW